MLAAFWVVRHQLFPKIYIYNNKESNNFQNKKLDIICIFGEKKIYQSWMTGKSWYLLAKQDSFTGQWLVTSTNSEASIIYPKKTNTCWCSVDIHIHNAPKDN